ncbi:TYW1 synthase, partial [Ptilorrhoa leucosticta]|nr:TYW1 synthase [Ptilorrhoa leucosticta]
LDVSMDTWSYFHTCLVSVWLHRFYIYSAVAFGISLWIAIQFTTTRTKRKKSHGNPASCEGTADKLGNGCASPQAPEVHVAGVKIFYGSQTGTAKRFAKALAEAVTTLNLPVEVINMGDYDPEDGLSEETSSRNICVFLVATYTEGQPPESAAWFCKWLEEAANDFRVGKSFLQGLRYAVFGLGNSAYVGRRMDRWLWMLSASRIMTRAEGDCNVAQSKHGSIEADFEAWKDKFLTRLQALCKGEKKPCSGKCKKGKCKSSGKQSKESSDHEHGTSEHENTEAEELFETSSEEEAGGTDSVIDVEDLGSIMGHMKKAKVLLAIGGGVTLGPVGRSSTETMVLIVLGTSLVDQFLQAKLNCLMVFALFSGYQLIGSHSGVKLCRWTKVCSVSFSHFMNKNTARDLLRYSSFLMKLTVPSSLRHHTNPVGTEWRWKMDQPEVILQEAIESHQNMIKQFKG